MNVQGMHSHPPRSMPLPATVAAGGGSGYVTPKSFAGTPVKKIICGDIVTAQSFGGPR
jgi:hypothetical protein